MADAEAGCFYHPQKKAVVPCEACGRFLCALCDCEFHGRHLCPACLESGKSKQSTEGFVSERVLYRRQALVLSILPLYITGMAAIYVALRRWAMPTALTLGVLQTVGFSLLILYAFIH
jgi:hypothetical protein